MGIKQRLKKRCYVKGVKSSVVVVKEEVKTKSPRQKTWDELTSEEKNDLYSLSA